MKKQFLNKGLLFLVIAGCTMSCSKDDSIAIAKTYTKTVVPTNISDLFEAKGDVAKDTVVVYAPGGPEPTLETTDIEEPQFLNYYRVYVNQSQHINPTIAQCEITFAQAVEETNISADMFQQVVEHFKSEGKVVIAMSHSFGSFILPQVLSRYENLADRVVIMGGRLDMPEIVWTNFRDGISVDFENGTTPVIDNDSPETDGDLSVTRLQASLGKNRYTELLADKKLGNLLYVYGTVDEAVGALNQEEIKFLENKSCTIFPVIPGDHSSMFAPNILDAILGWIRGNRSK